MLAYGLRLLQIAATIGHPSTGLAITLTFEDFPLGHFGTFGPRHVSRGEIIAFASEFDPPPMHVDDAAAKHTMLRGLSVSGWHLCSLMMRMMFDGYIGRTASLGSPGVDEVRWLSPLRPGDDLMLDVDVTAARASRSRPEMGIVTFAMRMHNASGQDCSRRCLRS
jgi:acyl dehydratase